MDSQNFCEEVEIDLPYPPITVEAQNLDYAISLFKLYAGFDSELTAANQYIYQNMLLQIADPTSAVLLECIASNEALHYRLLGRLIFLLGADPKLYSPTTFRSQTTRTQRETGTLSGNGNGYSWWSGELLLYTKEFTQMIQDNLYLEQITVANYNAAFREIEDIHVRALIERILLDEKRHIEIFTNMLNTAQANPGAANGA